MQASPWRAVDVSRRLNRSLCCMVMNETDTISLVRRYAAQWRVDVGDSFRIESERKFFRTIAHRVHHESDDWSGFAYVEAKADVPSTFDFRPKRSGLLMPPLWAAYPTYSGVTIGWRMGSGEDYRYAWWQWYNQQSSANREKYQHLFPAPVDERSWNLWFWDIAQDED